MKEKEREEINNLPEKYRPISAWGYLGYSLLFGLSGVGFILVIVFALSNENINRRNFARSYLCGLLIIVILLVIILIIALAVMGSFATTSPQQ